MLEKLRAWKGSGKKREIIINIEALETRVAVLEKGVLENFYVERREEGRIVGNIFKGKIKNLEDSLLAAFVDIGLKRNAFIHYWDMIPEDALRLEREEGIRLKNRTLRRKKYKSGEMEKLFPVGSEIVVQVIKDAIGSKGPRITANLSIPGRYLVMMPGSQLKGISRKIEDAKERNRLKKILSRLPIPENIGLIVRTAGNGIRNLSFTRDARNLFQIWNDLEKGIKDTPAPCVLYAEPGLTERVARDYLTEEIDRIYIDSPEMFETIKQLTVKFSRRTRNWVQLYGGEAPIFDYFNVEKQIESIYRRRIWMKSGAYLIFDETEALVAIDVNTGRSKSENSQKQAILQVNLESAEEVARQLRLRNIGGLVIVDFIDMKSRHDQQAVFCALKEALKKDHVRTNVLPISSLGLLEMTRQRVEESIFISGYADCHYCRGRGRVKSSFSMSVEIQRRVGESMRKKHGAHSIRITVNPQVFDRIRKEDEQALIEMEQKFQGGLTFVPDTRFHIEEFTITNEDNGRVLFNSVEI